jgi:hypothetical protein
LPTGTPIQKPVQTPECLNLGNSFAALQNDSEGKDGKSIHTITADDPQIEIKSDRSKASRSSAITTPEMMHTSSSKSILTPDEAKQKSTSIRPIAQILLTDDERHGNSIPICSSQLVQTVSKLFPDTSTTIVLNTSVVQQQSNPKDELNQTRVLKPPLVASFPPQVSLLSNQEDKELADDIFGLNDKNRRPE